MSDNLARVLIVEDDAVLGPALKRTLEPLTPISLLRSIRDARHALASGRRDLVITDERLPDGSGIELAERLRREPRPPRVTLITGFGTPDLLLRARLAGVDYAEKSGDPGLAPAGCRCAQEPAPPECTTAGF